jgi:DNA modification methylase
MAQVKSSEVIYRSDGLILVHGDCRHMEVLQDGSVDLVVTDPPFNVSGVHGRRVFVYGEEAEPDDRPVGDYIEWTAEWLAECLRVLRPGGQLYALMSIKWMAWWLPLVKDLKWHVLPWVKTMAFLHRANTYLRAWEPVLWLVKEGAPHKLHRTYHFEDDKDWLIGPSAVGEAEHRRLKKRHPTPRPDWLYEYFIVRASEPGMVVLDPMMGSGTAARTARSLGREFVGYEINRRYVDLAAQMIADVQYRMELVGEPSVADLSPSHRQLELLEHWNGTGLPLSELPDWAPGFQTKEWGELALDLARLGPKDLAAVADFVARRQNGRA